VSGAPGLSPEAARLAAPLGEEELARLEASVQAALESGSGEALEVLGYGEISTVLALNTAAGRFACKRLPVFPGEESLSRYAEVFASYLGALAEAGVKPLESRLQATPARGGGLAVYCVQPILEPGCLGPRYLAGCSEEEGRQLLEQIVSTTARAAGERLGVDAQLSNWALRHGELVYLDVTTPLLKDEQGRQRLDTRLFTASLPWALRGLVQALLLEEILGHYHARRPALLDLAANLYKERQERWLPVVLELANRVVDPPLAVDEVRRYYRSDARMWELLQRLRRLDRAWQRWGRRRIYPFLLPARIER
jgi:hypothetical protein